MAKKRVIKKSSKKINGKNSSKSSGYEVNKALAIVALILNIFVPGIGSLVGWKTKEGVLQLVLFLVGVPLIYLWIGYPMVLIAWVWGIITGIKLITEAK